MTEEIKSKIEKFREDAQRLIEKAESGVLELLKDRVVIYEERGSFISYCFVKEVQGSLCEDRDEENDFYGIGQCLELCFSPIPKFEIRRCNINLERDSINPKPVIREWNSELIEEIKGLLKKIIGEGSEIKYWETECLGTKEIYFIRPPFKGTFWKIHHGRTEDEEAIPEQHILESDLWELIIKILGK